MEVSRRGFLGGLCASLPLAGLVLSGRRILEAEYSIGFSGSDPVVVRAFTNGDLEATFRGQKLAPIDGRGWPAFGGAVDDTLVEIVVRRPAPGELDIDSLAIYKSTDGRVLKHAPISSWGFIPTPWMSLHAVENTSVHLGSFGADKIVWSA